MEVISQVARNHAAEHHFLLFEYWIPRDPNFVSLIEVRRQRYLQVPLVINGTFYYHQKEAERLRIATSRALQHGRLPPHGPPLLEGDSPPRRDAVMMALAVRAIEAYRSTAEAQARTLVTRMLGSAQERGLTGAVQTRNPSNRTRDTASETQNRLSALLQNAAITARARAPPGQEYIASTVEAGSAASRQDTAMTAQHQAFVGYSASMNQNRSVDLFSDPYAAAQAQFASCYHASNAETRAMKSKGRKPDVTQRTRQEATAPAPVPAPAPSSLGTSEPMKNLSFRKRSRKTQPRPASRG